MPGITEVYPVILQIVSEVISHFFRVAAKKNMPAIVVSGRAEDVVLHPLSVSSMGNTCLPFLPTVGYVPYNTLAQGQECCLC